MLQCKHSQSYGKFHFFFIAHLKHRNRAYPHKHKSYDVASQCKWKHVRYHFKTRQAQISILANSLTRTYTACRISRIWIRTRRTGCTYVTMQTQPIIRDVSFFFKRTSQTPQSLLSHTNITIGFYTHIAFTNACCGASRTWIRTRRTGCPQTNQCKWKHVRYHFKTRRAQISTLHKQKLLKVFQLTYTYLHMSTRLSH